MVPTFSQFWHELVERPEGKMAFRFYIQPLVATFLATRDGIRDAHAGRPAYFWALFSDHVNRRALLRQGWSAIRNLFIVALVLDTIYQIVVLHGLTPVEGLMIATVLALVPYLLIRGPANRITRTILRTRRRRSTI